MKITNRLLYFVGGLITAATALTLLGPVQSARHTSVVEVAKRVGPAVVNVSAEQVVAKGASPFGQTAPNPFFDEFFRDFRDPRYRRKQTRNSLGSGVIINAKGHVLTNEHVIIGAGAVYVNLMDGRRLKAELIGADPDSDLAVLRLGGASNLPYISMGDSDAVMVGEPAIAIGNPFGLGHTVTTGVISGTHRYIYSRERSYYDFIQTDASINPGNSGGPLLNADGELIGINSAIYQKGQGIGFATPINRAKRVVQDLIRYGEVQTGWFGIQVRDLTTTTAQNLGYTGQGGVVVSLIVEDSPGRLAGLKYGDVIESVNGVATRSKDEFRTTANQIPIGTKVRMEVNRKNVKTIIEVKSSAFPLHKAEEIGRYMLGITVKPAPTGNAGVVIESVSPGSPAARIGLRKGDLIVKINDIVLKGLPEWRKAISKIQFTESALILLRRGANVYYVTLPLSS